MLSVQKITINTITVTSQSVHDTKNPTCQDRRTMNTSYMGVTIDPVSYTHLDVYKRQGQRGQGTRYNTYNYLKINYYLLKNNRIMKIVNY